MSMLARHHDFADDDWSDFDEAVARRAGFSVHRPQSRAASGAPLRHPLAAADLEVVEAFPLHVDDSSPTLRLVEKRKRMAALAGVSRRRWTAAALVVVVLFAVVMVNVALHVEMARVQFRLTDLQKREVAAEKAYDQKRLEVARLEAPARVVAEARAQGMVPAPKVTPVHPQATPAPAEGTPGASNSDANGGGPDGGTSNRPAPAASQGGWEQLKPVLNRDTKK